MESGASILMPWLAFREALAAEHKNGPDFEAQWAWVLVVSWSARMVARKLQIKKESLG